LQQTLKLQIKTFQPTQSASQGQSTVSSATSDMESQLFQACTDGDLSALKYLITEQVLNPSDMKDP